MKPTLVQVIDELASVRTGHVVETHFDFEDPVKCDRVRIGQLLSNLFGNALDARFWDGPIRVNATIHNAVL